jgi:3'-phosphoadenosine 5'-phosphosulfate sulfotransferase (PAPS reductase)/FAD synthetase
MSRIVCHFSCGAASAVATKLALAQFRDNEIVIAYAETGSEDPDNSRFMKECEKWFGRDVIRLKNKKYDSTWDVWEKKKYIAGIHGAPCTGELKIKPQLEFQLPDDIHVFGYTADSNDIRRAEAFKENWPDLHIEVPLIDRGINKSACLAMIISAGVQPPKTYAIGFPNANCIPCCKAQSPAYWALVRQEYPVQFSRMAKLSHKLGAKLVRINGERCFIDEVPADQNVTEAIAPECDFLCQIAELDIVGIKND